jgi:hypothetical protein
MGLAFAMPRFGTGAQRRLQVSFASRRLVAAGLRVGKLLQHLIEREAAHRLARRELLERGDVLRDVFLRGEEQKSPVNPPVGVIDADMVAVLERIIAQIEDFGHAQWHERFLSDIENCNKQKGVEGHAYRVYL